MHHYLSHMRADKGACFDCIDAFLWLSAFHFASCIRWVASRAAMYNAADLSGGPSWRGAHAACKQQQCHIRAGLIKNVKTTHSVLLCALLAPLGFLSHLITCFVHSSRTQTARSGTPAFAGASNGSASASSNGTGRAGNGAGLSGTVSGRVQSSGESLDGDALEPLAQRVARLGRDGGAHAQSEAKLAQQAGWRTTQQQEQSERVESRSGQQQSVHGQSNGSVASDRSSSQQSGQKKSWQIGLNTQGRRQGGSSGQQDHEWLTIDEPVYIQRKPRS